MEAHWETNSDSGAPLLLFAVPDMELEKNRFEIKVPSMLSLLVTHSMTGRIPGLKEFPADQRPTFMVIFFSFRVMAGIGFLFLFVMIWAFVLWRKKLLFETRSFLITLLAIQPLGFIATITGWITAEMGRQPWIVYGIMRTHDGVSPIAARNVVWSLVLFTLSFGIIGGGYLYYIFRILKSGPDFDSPIPPVHLPIGMRPFSHSDQESL